MPNAIKNVQVTASHSKHFFYLVCCKNLAGAPSNDGESVTSLNNRCNKLQHPHFCQELTLIKLMMQCIECRRTSQNFLVWNQFHAIIQTQILNFEFGFYTDFITQEIVHALGLVQFMLLSHELDNFGHVISDTSSAL